MPQVDLETLVCGGGGGGGWDGRVACETLIGPGEGLPDTPTAEDPNLPAESIRLPIGDEIDWTDLNAVYDRDDSTKGNTNPKSQHSNPTKPRSNSQRFSGNLKPKTPIIGLPGKIQQSGYLGVSGRRPLNGRIFPKKGAAARSAGGGKAEVVESEPASPKVSCIGKVLSERERERRRRAHRRSADEAVERGGGGGGGCWAGLAGLFRCFGGGERRGAVVECVEESPAPPEGMRGRPRATEREAATADPPGLGGMKRFTSGRRPTSWGGDVDFEPDGHVASSAPLDRELASGRRSLGSLEDADRDRESECSASV